MKKRTLRKTLFRLIFILAIQTILILAGVIFISISLIQNSIIDRQELLISSLVTQNNLFLENTEQVMNNLANIVNEFPQQEQERILAQALSDYPRFASLQLVDTTGKVIAESTGDLSLLNLDVSGESYFMTVKDSKSPHFSAPFISLTTGNTALVVAMPILHENEFQGILAGEISLVFLQQVVMEHANFGEEITSFIVDQQGTLLAHPNPKWVQERRNLGNLPLVHTGLSGQEAVSLFYDEDQELWFIGSVQNMETGWPVLTIQPVSIAAQPIITMLVVSGMAFLLSLILFIIVVSQNVRGITQPISNLVERANALARGNFQESLAGNTSGEISEIQSLGQSFTRMTEALQERDRAIANQLEELRQAESETRQAQTFLNKVLENIPNMIFVKDAEDLRFFLLNQAAEGILGIDREQMIGKNDYDFFPETEADFFTQKDREVLRNGILLDIPEETIQTRHLGSRILHTKKVPILDEAGRPIYLLGISEDITERKQVEKKLKDYATELERSNQELQSFAYVSSHDLQEPLRKIQAFGDRLKSRYGYVLDERGLDYLARMQSAAVRMQSLIIALLAYSRIMTQYEPFVQVDLNKIIGGVISDLDLLVEDVNGRIHVSSLRDVEADATQMRQLFQNLISNALKYHKKDVPPIVHIDGQNLKNGRYQITVSDNGIGFDEKYLDRIFEVFQRLHGRDKYEGTGVGLAICRRIVERHHGSIIAKSTLEEGTSFEIILPCQQSAVEISQK